MYPNRFYGVSNSISESSRGDKRRNGSEQANGRNELGRRVDYLFNMGFVSESRCYQAAGINTERVRDGTMTGPSGEQQEVLRN